MNRFKFATLTRQQTLDVHQAARIVRDDKIRAGFGRGGAFDFAHRGGNHRELRGKSAAKTTAGFFLHLDKFQSADFTEQRARCGFDAEFAQAVAAVVKRNFVRKLRAEVGHAEFADEKIRKFPRARRNLFCQFRLWSFGKEFGIKLFDHCAAGAGTDDDSFGIFQFLQCWCGDGAGFVPVTGVEWGLAAAGDFVWANNFMAESFQNFHHADARARKQRVNETGNEKCDSHANATQLFSLTNGDESLKKLAKPVVLLKNLASDFLVCQNPLSR